MEKCTLRILRLFNQGRNAERRVVIRKTITDIKIVLSRYKEIVNKIDNRKDVNYTNIMNTRLILDMLNAYRGISMDLGNLESTMEVEQYRSLVEASIDKICSNNKAGSLDINALRSLKAELRKRVTKLLLK